MLRATVEDLTLEYVDEGAGEPVVLIHAGLCADWFMPLLGEPALAPYRRIAYHRAGYAGSSHPWGALTIADHARHCHALMRHLGIDRAHLVGHSSSALMALQTERRRELATLLALGLTPARLTVLTLLETGLIGAIAGLCAFPTGALLALVLVHVINVRSFGWTMALQWDPGVFAQALLVALLAALLAGLYPLVRLLRLPVAAALRQE